MNSWLTRALLLAILLLIPGRPALAGGPTSHLAQASFALDDVDPVLRNRLAAYNNAYLNGANFPDTFNLTSNLGTYLPALSYYTADEVHSAHFLSTYAAYAVANPGDDALLAHFMGTLAHVVGDQRFDRYFMTRTSRHCFPATYVATWAAQPDYGQVYTDQHLDWVLSPRRYVQGSPISTPNAAYVPWGVGHKSPLFVEHSVLELAYPMKTTIPYAYLATAVLLALDYIAVEPLFINNGVGEYGPASIFCDYAEATWEDGLGGARDGGRIIAEYLDRTFAIINVGGLPAFEEYGTWPNNELQVFNAWAPNPVKSDYVSWIAGPTQVDRLELEANRIVALQQTANTTGGLLAELNGEVDGPWVSLLVSPDRIADFQLDGEQTGVLLEDGRLLINTGDGLWHSVLSGVTSFQVEGSRLAALVQGELMIQDGGPLAPWTTLSLPVTDYRVEAVLRFQLEGDRVAVLTSLNNRTPAASALRIGEGLGSEIAWHVLWHELVAPGLGSAVSFDLDGDRVGVSIDDVLFAHQGPLGPQLASWSVQQTGVASFQMAGDCTAALSTTGVLSLQKDGLALPWEAIRQSVASFELAGYNASWSASPDPLLAFSLTDGKVLTNRDTTPWPNQTTPNSQYHALPGLVAASAFALEQTVPYSVTEGAIKIEDRLAVLVAGDVFVKELPRFKVDPSAGVPVSLSFFDGIAANYVQLNWSNYTTAGSQDYVALYDRDPIAAGPNGYLAGQWQWAVYGPTWVSNTQWAPGYYVAYVREDAYGNRTITHTWGPTTVAAGPISVERNIGVLGDWVEIKWDSPFAGASDYVALYDQDPLLAGPDGYLTLQWKYATSGSSWVSSKEYTAGYYAAYIQEDALGNRIILDTAGPTTTTNANVWLTVYSGVFYYYVQLNWSVTDPGAYDYVALYDQDPNVAGPDGYLSGEWQWATKGPYLVSNKVWAGGYWVAYIQEDAQGNRTILDTWGPIP